jgi:hypothetical protein
MLRPDWQIRRRRDEAFLGQSEVLRVNFDTEGLVADSVGAGDG